MNGDTLNTITKVRLPNGQEVGIVDWSWKPLYSTVDFLSGFTDAEVRAFNYGLGDNVSQSSNIPAAGARTATLKDTNISGVAEMSSTEEMLVYAIGIETYEFDYNAGAFEVDEIGLPIPRGPNLAIMHERIIVELEVSEKAFYQASYGWFQPGFGVQVSSSASLARTYANGGMTRDAIDRAPVPVHIGGTEKYALIFHNPTGAAVTFTSDAAGAADSSAALRSRASLIGLYKRPVG